MVYISGDYTSRVGVVQAIKRTRIRPPKTQSLSQKMLLNIAYALVNKTVSGQQ